MLSTDNPEYWRRHKLLFNQFLDELDKWQQDEVMNNPKGMGAKLFLVKVDKAVKLSLHFPLDTQPKN